MFEFYPIVSKSALCTDSDGSGTYAGSVAALTAVPLGSAGNWTPRNNPGIARVDLLVPKAVKAVAWQAGDQRATINWNIDYSQNATTWTTFVTRSDGGISAPQTYDAPAAVIARYWRLAPVGGSGHYGLSYIGLFANTAGLG